MKDSFFTYHPVVNMLYFVLVLGFSMFFLHPVCLAISLICAFTYAIYLGGKKTIRFTLVALLPMFIITILLNPAFNHEGNTILTYLPDGNPLTLESILYGIVTAVTMISVVSWFSCYNAIMTSDKFVYLFGRIIPALSLILSMALRFVPRFTTQLKVVRNAQRCIGRDVSSGSILKRARHGIHILSIMITWALENAIDTADSMKCRGYGLQGRTAFSIYTMHKRDKYALGFLLACGGYITVGAIFGGFYFRYFPTLKGVSGGVYSASLFVVYFFLCIMPLIINFREEQQWKAIRSKI